MTTQRKDRTPSGEGRAWARHMLHLPEDTFEDWAREEASNRFDHSGRAEEFVDAAINTRNQHNE